MGILVPEGVSYHNQSKHFLYTLNPGPPLILPNYIRRNAVYFELVNIVPTLYVKHKEDVIKTIA